jgi:type IV pilus assembly protein PilV
MRYAAAVRMRIPRTIRGFTLIEVLVTLVVMGVGLLGMASLYAVSLRSSGSAIYRMQAVNLASDLADRIRANRTAGTNYEGTPTAHDCETRDCSPKEMAENDLFTWQAQINATLPGNASGTVDVDDSTEPSTYIITIKWQEPGQAEDLEYTMRMQI